MYKNVFEQKNVIAVSQIIYIFRRFERYTCIVSKLIRPYHGGQKTNLHFSRKVLSTHESSVPPAHICTRKETNVVVITP